MNWTNEYNLPEVLVKRLTRDDYDYIDDPKHYSVTELINPPRMALLLRRHHHELTRDVSQRFFIWLGNLTHKDIFKANVSDGFQEERLFWDVGDGYTISGKADMWQEKIWFDNYEPMKPQPKPGELYPCTDVNKIYQKSIPTGLLTDWKLTSVWAAIRQDKTEWEQQLNCYAFLYREQGFEVNRLRIYALLRDWRVGELKRQPHDYPPIPFLDKEIPMWDNGGAKRFIEARLDILKQLEREADFNLPVCSPDERWAKEQRWAVMKEGRKSALKLCNSEPEAETYIRNLEPKLARICSIEERPTDDVRCKSYCDAAAFCDYYHQNVKDE